MRSYKRILLFLLAALCLNLNTFAQAKAKYTPTESGGAVKKTVPAKKPGTTAISNGKAGATPVGKKPTPANSSTARKSGTVNAKQPAVKASTTKTATVTPLVAEKHYDYKNAFGIRAGQTAGITIKHFISSNEAVEGIIGVWPNAVGLTGLYEKYVPSENVEGFNWYFGGGAHMSFATGRLYTVYKEGRYYSYRAAYPGVGVGIDGILGAEYKIPSAPFALSFDIKPFIEVNSSGVLFTALDPGLGIKFTF